MIPALSAVLAAMIGHAKSCGTEDLLGCRYRPRRRGKYQCPCGPAFNDVSRFRKHLRVAHGSKKSSFASARRWRRPGEVKPRR